MSDIKYTPSQEKAIEYNDGNLLISAAAGSGKTAVLTEKIARLIADGKCSADELLVVTFTKAAAAEMKQRIKNKLISLRSEKNQNRTLSSYINGQLSSLSSADICTMDSFLYKRVRKYFPVLGLSPDTRIASEGELCEIETRAMSKTVNSFFARNNSSDDDNDWLFFCDLISKTKDTSHIDTELLGISHTLESKNIDISQLRQASERFDGSGLLGEVKKCVASFAAHYAETFSRIMDDIEADELLYKAYYNNITDDCEICASLREAANKASDFAPLKTYVDAVKFSRLGTLKKEYACETSAAYKTIRDNCKEDLKELRNAILFGDEMLLLAEKNASERILNVLCALLDEYGAEVNREKNSRGIMSYHDLEALSAKILSADNIADEIAKKYKYIFIDEFQDTDSTQDYIFERLSAYSNRFFVGDIKQSIYKFRGADPSVFNNYKNIWKNADGGFTADTDSYTLYMSENFRCSREIISFTNLVTGTLFPMSDITYTDSDKLIFAASGICESHPVEITILPKSSTGEGINYEAEYVASTVKSLIGEYSSDLKRTVAAGDIAILLRSPASHGAEFKNALTKRGIKCRLRRTEPLESFSSVKLILSLLEIINNPLDDIYLSGALLSPVFGFTLDELSSIKIVSSETHLFVSLYSYLSSEEHDAALADKIQHFIDRLNTYRSLAHSTRADIFAVNFISENSPLILSACIDTTSINGASYDPLESDAVRRLLDLIGQADSDTSSSLSELIKYIETEIPRDHTSDEGDASLDAVKILSIHSSKGLEFPICFLCETDRRRTTTDESRPMLFDSELGFGTKISDDTGLSVKPTLKHELISERMAASSSFEEIRMLYVAMTRAKNRLFITGKESNIEGLLQKTSAMAYNIDAYTATKHDTYLYWILMCCANTNSDDYILNTPSADEISQLLSCSCPTSGEEESSDNGSTPSDIPAEVASCLASEREPSPNIPVKAMAGVLSPVYLDLSAENSISDDSDNNNTALVMPKFITGANTYTAAEKGTAMHTFMQFMDIKNLGEKGIYAEITRMTEHKIISRKLAAMLDKRQIYIFMRSDLFRRISMADYIKREFRFNINLPAADFTENEELSQYLTDKDSMITVQGVIDCLYRNHDTGLLELVDYKTDGFTAEEYKNHDMAHAKLRERHKNQLETYRVICEKIFGEPLRDVYIYSTVLGEMVKI